MRHANQQALTVKPERRRERPRRDDVDEDTVIPNLSEDLLIRNGTKLPNRYWLRSESGGWYSVPRGSPAHRADRDRLSL